MEIDELCQLPAEKRRSNISQGQIDFYDDPKLIAPAADAAAAFLR